MAAIKSKDLAKEIGVSTATISLVLNGKPGISDKTRAMVEQKIRDLGYGDMLHHSAESTAAEVSRRSSGEAERNASSENRSVGFVLFQRSGDLLAFNSFFPLILDGIEKEARSAGYNLLVLQVSASHIEADIRRMTDSGCAGYVIFGTEMHSEDLPYFSSLGLPFVVFDNEFFETGLCYTKVNNRQGSYLAIRHLVRNGHRRIGYLSSELNIDSFRERESDAYEAMRELGLDTAQCPRYRIGYPHDRARAGMEKVLAETDRKHLPTAFFGDNDLVMVGAMQALQEAGLRVPEDVSLIGFDDRPECTIVTPKLTTVQLPRDLFGAAALRQLLFVLRNPDSGSLTQEVNGVLVSRESVGAPREDAQ